MNKTKEYQISNKWIWAASIAPLTITPTLFKKIEILSFSMLDLVLFAGIFTSTPIIAMIYRSKVIANDDAFVIHRGLIGGCWLTKSKPQKYRELIEPEENDKGYLCFVLENGKEIAFDPVKHWKDLFVRKNK